jgi:drug/metabolite transporter (DMT)-like permease
MSSGCWALSRGSLLGIFLGHFLRGLPVNSQRLRLCLIVISGFLCGGIAGTLAFQQLHYVALFIPAILTATTSLVYGSYFVFHHHNPST